MFFFELTHQKNKATATHLQPAHRIFISNYFTQFHGSVFFHPVEVKHFRHTWPNFHSALHCWKRRLLSTLNVKLFYFDQHKKDENTTATWGSPSRLSLTGQGCQGRHRPRLKGQISPGLGPAGLSGGFSHPTRGEHLAASRRGEAGAGSPGLAPCTAPPDPSPLTAAPEVKRGGSAARAPFLPAHGSPRPPPLPIGSCTPSPAPRPALHQWPRRSALPPAHRPAPFSPPPRAPRPPQASPGQLVMAAGGGSGPRGVRGSPLLALGPGLLRLLRLHRGGGGCSGPEPVFPPPA